MTGRELKIKRVAAGLTQWDVAKQLGIQPVRISEMETGKRPIADAVIEVLDREMAGVGVERSK